MTKVIGKRVLLLASYGNLQDYWFPLSVGYLKSNMPSHHGVKILDCTFEDLPPDSEDFRKKIEDFKPDVVGISSSSLTYKYALQALETCKSVDKNIVTVMGGPHPTIYPDIIMTNDFVDFLFRGESELSFPKFLDQLDGGRNFAAIKGLVYRKDGAIVKNELEAVEDIDKIRIPDYAALKLNEYIEGGYNYGGYYGRTAPIWITRGCPYKCQFCSAPLINGRKIRAHSFEYMVEWLEHLYHEFNIRQFSIVDDNFTYYKEYAKDFCRGIIELKEKKHFKEQIYFTSPNGIRIERVDEELMRLMKRAGWDGVTVAPESGSPDVLKRMKKGLNPDIVPGVVKMIKSVGLNVRGFFMVGYPGETKKDLEETIRLIRKCKFDSLVIGRFIPLPGTPVFDDLVQRGEISPDYTPPQNFKLFLPFQKKVEQKMYTPKDFEGFSLFKMLLREHLLLALRNPYSVYYFLKYYGLINVARKFYSLYKKPV